MRPLIAMAMVLVISGCSEKAPAFHAEITPTYNGSTVGLRFALDNPKVCVPEISNELLETQTIKSLPQGDFNDRDYKLKLIEYIKGLLTSVNDLNNNVVEISKELSANEFRCIKGRDNRTTIIGKGDIREPQTGDVFVYKVGNTTYEIPFKSLDGVVKKVKEERTK
jgi:hypothetical protein